MKAILELEQMGYTFALDGDAARYTHNGQRPDPERVRPLLELLRQNHKETVRFLQSRISQKAHNTADFEAEAEELRKHCDGSIEWARRWAELHDEWGIPCFGFHSWAEWAEGIL